MYTTYIKSDHINLLLVYISGYIWKKYSELMVVNLLLEIKTVSTALLLGVLFGSWFIKSISGAKGRECPLSLPPSRRFSS